MKMWVVAGMLMLAAGCTNYSPLSQRYEPSRADYGDRLIPVIPQAPKVDVVNPTPVGDSTGPTVIEQIKGTWVYTVPPTVTRVDQRTAEFSQASLYNGRPKATDTPFLVIHVGPSGESLVEADKDTYTVTAQRSYVFNGAFVNERQGKTKSGGGFVELIFTKPVGGGDVCRAVAVAKTAEERKLALDIIHSIVWKANEEAATAPAQ